MTFNALEEAYCLRESVKDYRDLVSDVAAEVRKTYPTNLLLSSAYGGFVVGLNEIIDLISIYIKEVQRDNADRRT